MFSNISSSWLFNNTNISYWCDLIIFDRLQQNNNNNKATQQNIIIVTTKIPIDEDTIKIFFDFELILFDSIIIFVGWEEGNIIAYGIMTLENFISLIVEFDRQILFIAFIWVGLFKPEIFNVTIFTINRSQNVLSLISVINWFFIFSYVTPILCFDKSAAIKEKIEIGLEREGKRREEKGKFP